MGPWNFQEKETWEQVQSSVDSGGIVGSNPLD